MSAAPDAAVRLALATDLIARESAALDEKRWDDWLALFAPDVEFQVPTWTAEGQLTGDPRTQLSLMYFSGRGGLEDRVARIRSGRSPANMPGPRTTHMVSNILERAAPSGDRLYFRSSWVCHAFYPLMEATHALFGRAEYDFALSGGRWLIARKRTILENDRIPMAIDVYCL